MITISEWMNTVKTILSTWLTELAAYLPRVVTAIIIIVAAFFLIKLIMKLLKRQLDRFVDVTMHKFITSAAQIMLWVFALLLAADRLGLDTTSVITAIGAAGVAVALALQNSLSNLASGIIMLFNKSFKVGDYIEVGGVSGTVANIDLMFTALDSADNKRIVVPNSTLSANTVINYTYNDVRRVDLVYDVAYEDSLDRVKSVIFEVIRAQEKVLTDYEPLVEVMAHSANSVKMATRVWCKTDDYWDVYFSMNLAIKEAFEKNNIKIPFNQVDVHFFPPLNSSEIKEAAVK